MSISVGQRLPEATLVRIGENGPEQVSLSERLAGRKVVLFAVPGAFTPTCHSAHVPSFIRAKPGFDGEGVEEIICISVNDAHVIRAWGDATGATEAGITLLADPESTFTEAVGMRFDAPPVGMIGRCKRFALLAEDGVVKIYNEETARGSCDISGGEALLEALIAGADPAA